MAEARVAAAPVARKGGGQGEMLLRWWGRLAGVPGGKWAFSKLVGWKAPYSGSVKPRVEELAPGWCRVAIRNGLRSAHRSRIHAVALLNVAEAASGLATLAALPGDVRGIITRLEIEFSKKARGRITADCRTSPPANIEAPTPHVAEVTLTDESGDPVALARATWTLAPTPR